jgi:hypothetical protein
MIAVFFGFHHSWSMPLVTATTEIFILFNSQKGNSYLGLPSFYGLAYHRHSGGDCEGDAQ